MNRYDELYAAVDRAFAGTPNTPSALAAKTEILENLTAKYDDFLASGLDEAEAVRLTVDSIGDVNELFGTAAQTPDAPSSPAGAVGAPVEPSDGEPAAPCYSDEAILRGKRIQRALIAVGVALYVLSPVGPILNLAGVPEGVAASLLFVLCGLATAMIVGSGLCLPWNDRKGKLLLGLGVGGCVWGLVPMLILESVSEGLAISLMFAVWAVSVVLILLGTACKSKPAPCPHGTHAVSKPEVPEEFLNAYRPVQTVLLLLVLGVYLGVSILWNGWIYTWLLWPMYGCLCRILRAAFWLSYNRKEGGR